MNFSFKTEEAFVKLMREYRQTCSMALEKGYYDSHGDSGNHRIRNELYHDIMKLLGLKRWMMIKFVEKEAACIKIDPDYFYNVGFRDCFVFLQTIKGVNGNSICLEKILEFGSMDMFGLESQDHCN